MNNLHFFLLTASQTTGDETSSSSSTSGASEKLTETLKQMVASPIFYIVLGAIVLLIIAFYFFRRFIKATPNAVKVVVRKGKIYKLIDEKEPKYFLVPFTDRVEAVISLEERDLATDKLFINNGPDALYKVNLSLKYKVANVTEFFPYRENIGELIVARANEVLREYADEGHALDIVKDYRKNEKLILELLNKGVEEYSVEITSFKVNYIEPIGGNI